MKEHQSSNGRNPPGVLSTLSSEEEATFTTLKTTELLGPPSTILQAKAGIQHNRFARISTPTHCVKTTVPAFFAEDPTFLRLSTLHFYLPSACTMLIRHASLLLLPLILRMQVS